MGAPAGYTPEHSSVKHQRLCWLYRFLKYRFVLFACEGTWLLLFPPAQDCKRLREINFMHLALYQILYTKLLKWFRYIKILERALCACAALIWGSAIVPKAQLLMELKKLPCDSSKKRFFYSFVGQWKVPPTGAKPIIPDLLKPQSQIARAEFAAAVNAIIRYIRAMTVRRNMHVVTEMAKVIYSTNLLLVFIILDPGFNRCKIRAIFRVFRTVRLYKTPL